MTSVAVEVVANGDAVMGNETSRVEIKHDIGYVEKPGQFHRVLVDPDYSEIETPTLTKVSAGEGLETIPQPVASSSTQDSNVETKDTSVDELTKKLNSNETDSNTIRVIAKEIVDNAVTAAVAKVNGETDTNGINSPNGQTVSEEKNVNDAEIAAKNIEVTLDNKSEKSTAVKEKGIVDNERKNLNVSSNNIEVIVNGDNRLESSLDSQTTTELEKKNTKVTTESLQYVSTEENAEGVPAESSDDSPQINIEVNGESLPLDNGEDLPKITTGETINNLSPEKSKKKDKSKKKKSEQNKRERELIESVQNEFGEIKPELTEKKSGKGLGFMKMFKFSKNKPNAVGDISSNNLDEKQEKSIIENLNNKKDETQNEIESTIGHVSTNHIDNKISNGDYQANVIQNGQKLNEETIEIDSNVPGVKRMNSLDSGIVVEKVSEFQPESKDIDVKPVVGVKQPMDSDKTESDIQVNKSIMEKTITHVNGEQLKEVVTNFNERGVDVGDIKTAINTKEIANEVKEIVLDSSKEKLNTPNTENSPSGLKVRKLSIGEDKDSVASDQTTESDEKPKSVKIKKKSWSFQIGGSKKKVEGLETADEAKDKTSEGGEVKKPRWRFGKLSFRRQQSDVSVSTPNLTQNGIPEEGAPDPGDKKKDDKKKNKLKKIKAKKEKKKEAKRREEEARSSRSNSMLEGVLGDMNRPGSRRSIVEEDTPYATTDAFDGVDLADLSADEETQELKTPAVTGGKTESKRTGFSAKAKGFFKSDKKKSPSSPTTKENPKSLDNLHIIEDGEYAQIRQDNEPEIVPVVKPSVDTETKDVSTKEELAEAVTDVRASVGALYAQVVRQDKEEDIKTVLSNKEENKQTEESFISNVASTEEIKKESTTEAFATPSKSLSDETEENCLDTSKPYTELSFTDQVLQSANNVMNGDNKDTENDAYVQLEPLVDNNKPAQEVKNLNLEQDIQEIDTEQAVTETKPDQYVTELKSGLNTTEIKTDHHLVEIKPNQQVPEIKPEQIVAEIEPEVSLEQEVVPTVSQDSVTISDQNIVGTTGELVKHTIDDINHCEKECLSNIEADTECVAKYCSETKIELVQPVNVNSTYTAPAKEKTKSRVIIMKEVGVQAPDIHMPLDIEKDFGFSSEQLPTVSIGIQVSDGTVEETNDGRKISQISNKISPAYF